MSDVVIAVGKCPGCQSMSRLEDGCCGRCSRFGKTFGKMALRIRNDPDFKAKCFKALSSEVARGEFMRMFGEVG